MAFWQMKEPLTARDHEILRPLMERAKALGRTPMVAEVPSAALIQSRFRIWKTAVFAAGLPAMNDPEQVRLREAERRADNGKETQ